LSVLLTLRPGGIVLVWRQCNGSSARGSESPREISEPCARRQRMLLRVQLMGSKMTFRPGPARPARFSRLSDNFSQDFAEQHQGIDQES
jgi:hypothetical protein